jgi:hypothetical protein
VAIAGRESLTLNRSHHETHGKDRRAKRRFKRGPNGERHHLPLTDEGMPAATPEAPKPSPAVAVSDAARARYPWLPARVIAGSVWRGPEHLRVRVDEGGDAAPWRCGAVVAAR